MRYMPSSGTTRGNHHSRCWLIMILTLLSCLLIPACDATSVNGNGNKCIGPNTCNTVNNSNVGASTSTPSGVLVPSPTPTPTPTPTPPPEPKIYRADWSSGMGGWTATNDWHIVNGMLVNDGTQHASEGNPTAFAPYPPQDIANYSVQAEIRLDKYTDAGDYGADSFGIAVRYSDSNGGYKLGACASAPGYSLVTPCDASDFAVSYVLILSDGDFSNDTPVKKVPFQPGSGNWHTYRIDVQGNTITVWIDGSMVFQVTDDKFLSAGQVGLWSDRCQISIRSFTITAL
jgi:hypothetical protein